ncbi:MAG: hypothetical protein NW220_19890, partial [Leptolyngbyaceae cyanobacterium bins.349]|nr:hypothetical protein [Leptolyngbyaceae cyanobacterium bins.349]
KICSSLLLGATLYTQVLRSHSTLVKPNLFCLGGRPPKPPNVEDGCVPTPPPEGTTGTMQRGWDGAVVG